MLSKYKIYSESKLGFLGRKLSWIHPNTLTIIGIIPQVLFFIFMKEGNLAWGAIMLVLTSVDMLDGLVARYNNKTSAFGAFLDSTVDRLGDFLIIAGLYASGLVRLETAATLLLITFLISYVRSRGELASNGRLKFDVGFIERPERIIFVFVTLMLAIIFPNAGLLGLKLAEFLIVILTILSLVTLTQRILYAYRRL